MDVRDEDRAWDGTYSGTGSGLGASRRVWRAMGAGESSIISSLSMSTGVERGVGEVTSIWLQKGALCGRGDMSISSLSWPGEDDGRGGVVTHAAEDGQREAQGLTALKGRGATLTARVLRPEHVGGEESTTRRGKVRAVEEN